MDKEQYLVSICIPTYNRAPYLKQCLDSLVCQPEFLEGKVEIVISDNASTDETKEIASIYVQRYKNIKYYRNLTNTGFKNLGIAIDRSHGCLRKICNDDSIFFPGSLNFFCDLANIYKNEKPVLYFSNEKKQTTEIETFSNPEQFLKRVSFNITWIGTFSIWDIDCKSLKEGIENSHSNFWHVERTFELISHKRNMMVISGRFQKRVPLRQKNLGYGLYQTFYLNYMGMIQELVEQDVISSKCQKMLEKDLFYHFFLPWILLWEQNDNKFIFSSKENLRNLVFEQCRKRSYWSVFYAKYLLKKAKAKLKMMKW